MPARPWMVARRWGAVAALAGVAAWAAQADRAQASPGPEGVRPGHNVSVFHNIDMVATFGHGSNDVVRVDVVRDGHRIATARGPVIQLGPPENGALEVNHGVAGGPLPGDCWEGGTPDVRPGDLIRVSSAGGVDEVVVDDVTIERVTRDPGPNGSLFDDDDQVWVEGNARSGVDGSPIDLDTLDSAEYREPDEGDLRLVPNDVVAGPAPGTYRARYHAPFEFDKGEGTPTGTVLNQLERPDGHSFGFGHTEPATGLVPETMLVEGAGLSNGPAEGCEGVAPLMASSAGTTSADALTASALGALDTSDTALTVGGWAEAGLAEAEVALSDGSGTTVRRAAAGLDEAATDQQAWSAEFSKDDVEGLGDGTLNAQLLVGGTPTGAAKTVRLDRVVPDAPGASPGPGTYSGAQLVELEAEPGTTIRYTVDGSAPTATSPRFGGPLLVDRTMTIRAVAIDAAGNVSDVATLAFSVRVPTVPAPAGPLPLPGLQVLGATASSPSTAAVAPASATLRVSRVSAPSRRSARGARRNGVVASFVTPAGAEYAEARLYRVADGRRTLLGKRVLATDGGRREVARFTSKAVRRKLKAGLYVLEIRTGPALERLGPAVVKSLRVTR